MNSVLRQKPFALIILDGCALNPDPRANAVQMANTPCLDSLLLNCPHTTLCSFGPRVGLPAGQMGNSEVGHLNIGGGRVVMQDLLRIERAIEQDELGKMAPLSKLFEAVNAGDNRALHCIGLLSQGGVHSDADHLQALIAEALTQGVNRIFIHCITDGRDRPTRAAKQEVAAFQAFLDKAAEEHPEADLRIVSLVGRYFAMDRDKRWERVQKAYDLFTLGEAEQFTDIQSALLAHYEKGQTDEFHEPAVIGERHSGERSTRIEDGDGLLFYNFRADRMRQLVPTFFDNTFDGFERSKKPTPVGILTLTEYEPNFPVMVLFPPQAVPNHFGEVLSKAGLRQLRIAETEKYPHVTYFFNGGVEEPLPGEDRLVVPSKRDVATYDLVPEMSAPEITERLCSALQSGEYDVAIVNYANGDMVGHTGNLEAAIQAVETVDSCLAQVLDVIRQEGGAAIITADHGNADQMVDYTTGEPHTYHTKHPVPCIIFGVPSESIELKNDGALCDIAPTALAMLGLNQPEEMTGHSLLKKPIG